MPELPSHFLYPSALFASREPYIVNTILGSCVAVCLYDVKLQIGGINHYMLPFWNGQGLASPKFGNIAISKLLEKMIVDLIYKGVAVSAESLMVGNLRHIQLIRKAQKNIAQAGESLDNKLSLELIAQEVKEALSCFDDLLGKSFSGEILDKIFSEFCIGK